MTLNILSADIQIVDRMVDITTKNLDYLRDNNPDQYNKIQSLIELMDQTLSEQEVSRGQKAKIDFSQFKAFSTATSGIEGSTAPGGSSGNTLYTLSKLLNTNPQNKAINVTMFGIVGDDVNSQRIISSLESADIQLIPPRDQINNPQAATSFVFKHDGGSRTTITYPGNARDFLKPHLIADELIHNSDILFVQGSLWEKLDEAFPDRLLERRYHEDGSKVKELWLALPTHAKYRDNMPPKRYRALIPSADVVLSNDEELMRVYETKSLDDALRQLQEAIQERDNVLARENKAPHKTPAVAFVTCGKEGAMVVTPTEMIHIDPPDISQYDGKIFSVGAGDNAYAGFLAGHVAGLKPEKSAKLGMQTAGAKLGVDGARMADPRTQVTEFSFAGKKLLEELDTALREKEGTGHSGP